MIGVCILVTKLEELELMQIALHKKEEAGEGVVEEGKSENLSLCQVLTARKFIWYLGNRTEPRLRLWYSQTEVNLHSCCCCLCCRVVL